MSNSKRFNKLVVIVGPTASGKSALAVKLAKRFGGEIVSADSRQVYRGLDIGSGKITKKEMRGIPHHLLDIANPSRTYTVAHFQKQALHAFKDIWKRGAIPILVGGTGFYIQAVIDGLIIPDVKPNQRLRKALEKKSADELFDLLRLKDPERAASIDRMNKRRLVRALEIVEARGIVPKLTRTPLPADVLIIGIKHDLGTLKKHIHARLLRRMKQGLIKEVKQLHASTAGRTGLSWKRLEQFGLEYRAVARYLQGHLTKIELTKTLEKEIVRYAKRQMTWFKRDTRIHWIRKEKEAVRLIQTFLK